MIYLALIIVQVLFGLNVTASKFVIAEIDPLYWNLIRLFLSSVILLIFCTLTRKKLYTFSATDILLKAFPLSFIGFVLAPNLFLFGLEKSSAINASIISTTIPIMTLLLSIIFGDEKLNLMRAFGFGCAFFGVYTLYDTGNVSLTNNDENFGNMLILMGCFCVASYFVLTRKFVISKDHLWTTLHMFTLGIIGLGVPLMFFYTPELPHLPLEPVTILAGLFSVVGGTVLAYLLNNWALSKLNSVDVSLFVYLQPLVVGVFGYIFLGQSITARLVIASLLIFSGLALFKLSHTKKIAS